MAAACSYLIAHKRVITIKGLISQGAKDTAKEEGIREAIPEQWQERLRLQGVTEESELKDVDLSLVPTSVPDPAVDLSDFDLQSGTIYCFIVLLHVCLFGPNVLKIAAPVLDLWTASGREPLISCISGAPIPERDNTLISDREVTQIHRHAPCIPGALSVDPLVRGIVREESGLKVSENAIWLLIVAVRQYTEGVVKDTVSHLESVRSERSLDPIQFAPCAIRSGNMAASKSTPNADGEKSDAGKKDSADTKTSSAKEASSDRKPKAGAKRRRVTPSDIASALNGTRLSEAGSLSGSVSSLAHQRCYQASFNGIQPDVPPALDSVQSFLLDRIESASKRPRHEWRDPDALPTPRAVAPIAPKPRQQSPRKRTSKGSSTCSPGLGKEARNVGALPVVAKAATASRPSPAPTAAVPRYRPQVPVARPQVPAAALPPNIATNAPMPYVPQTPPAFRGGYVAPSPTVGVRESPPSASPRGRGRGFGVKDLAAMKARSGSTPRKLLQLEWSKRNQKVVDSRLRKSKTVLVKNYVDLKKFRESPSLLQVEHKVTPFLLHLA